MSDIKEKSRLNDCMSIFQALHFPMTFSLDLIEQEHGERIAGDIALIIKDGIGFNMMRFTEHCVCIYDLPVNLVEKIANVLRKNL